MELNLYRHDEFVSPGLFSFAFGKEKNEGLENQGETFAVGTPVEEVDQEVYEETLQHFLENLQVEPAQYSRLVSVSFDSEDPALAARIVNALASNYIEQNLEARWEAKQDGRNCVRVAKGRSEKTA